LLTYTRNVILHCTYGELYMREECNPNICSVYKLLHWVVMITMLKCDNGLFHIAGFLMACCLVMKPNWKGVSNSRNSHLWSTHTSHGTTGGAF
jgi:hypothetical protein